MPNIVKDGVYDMPEICPIKLNGEQVEQMFDLFSKPGWALLMQMRKVEADASVAIGMDLTKPEEQRTMARAAYHKQMADLCFSDMFEASVDAAHDDVSSQNVKKEKKSIDN